MEDYKAVFSRLGFDTNGALLFTAIVAEFK